MAKMSKLYNKGKRSWPFDIGKDDKKKTIFCNPGRSVELTTARCEKLVKEYPNDFVLGDKLASSTASGDIKKLTSLNKKLVTENENLKSENEKLTEELEELKASLAPAAQEKKPDPGK